MGMAESKNRLLVFWGQFHRDQREFHRQVSPDELPLLVGRHDVQAIYGALDDLDSGADHTDEVLTMLNLDTIENVLPNHPGVSGESGDEDERWLVMVDSTSTWYLCWGRYGHRGQ